MPSASAVVKFTRPCTARSAEKLLADGPVLGLHHPVRALLLHREHPPITRDGVAHLHLQLCAVTAATIDLREHRKTRRGRLHVILLRPGGRSLLDGVATRGRCRSGGGLCWRPPAPSWRMPALPGRLMPESLPSPSARGGVAAAAPRRRPWLWPPPPGRAAARNRRASPIVVPSLFCTSTCRSPISVCSSRISVASCVTSSSTCTC